MIMSTSLTLFIISLLSSTCKSSLSTLNPDLSINATKSSTTATSSILTTSSYYNDTCNNFTSCDLCMNSIYTHNIHCSWIESSNTNTNPNDTFYECISTDKCSVNNDIECCTSLVCCNCLKQTSCISCGSQGLNSTCLWDHTHSTCFTPNHTCLHGDKCLNNPSILQCEYSNSGACSWYFSTTSFWTLGYCGMLIFFICLPCCLYHRCGIDWDSEFSLSSFNNSNYALQQNDAYVFKGGAHITGRCMYGSFLFLGFLFASIAIFGTILSISCLDEQY